MFQSLRVPVYLQVDMHSAEQVCDGKIAEWLRNRKKHTAYGRRHNHSSPPAPWIQKIYPKETPASTEASNTPKRSTNSLRRDHSAGPLEPNVFSPLTPSMIRKPTVRVRAKKKESKQVSCVVFFVFLLIIAWSQDNQDLLRELKKREKEAMVKRATKRVERYKNQLAEQLSSQINVWSAREQRLLKIISGTDGVSIAALLPDPPSEVDPDTDDESKKDDEYHNIRGVQIIIIIFDPH